MKTGEELKAEGIEKVTLSCSEWVEMAVGAIARYMRAVRDPFALEDVVTALSLPEPPHPNAKGGAINSAVKLGLIRPWGFRKAKSRSARARIVRTWVAA